MITGPQAYSLIQHRLPTLTAERGGVAHLQGNYTLHELEALCIHMRNLLGDRAEGAEEYLSRTTDHEVTMPLVQVESTVRRYCAQLKQTVSETLHEDIAQVNNPGSVPVYGEAVQTGSHTTSVTFSNENLFDLTTEQLAVAINEMNQELAQRGCSLTTQIMAGGMLWAAVLKKEQEEAIRSLEKRVWDKPAPKPDTPAS